MKLKLEDYLFAFTMPMLFLSSDGSFNVRSIIFIVFFMAISTRKMSLVNISYLMLALSASYTISLICALIFFRNTITSVSFIRLIYFYCIAVYFVLGINKPSSKAVRLAINMYIFTCIIVSLLILNKHLQGIDGKLTISTFNNTRLDPNMTGAILSVSVIWILLKIYFYRSPIKLFAYFILLALNGFATLLTGSRAALVALIVSIAFFAGISFIDNKSSKQRIFYVICAAIILTVAIQLLAFLPEFIKYRFFHRSYVDASNSDRIAIWVNAIKGWTESPILGYGIGNFSVLHNERLTLKITDATSGTFVAHNTYLDVLVDGGLLAFLIFLGIGFKIFTGMFNKQCRLLLPVFFCIFITSFIFGASKAVYFWHTLIILYNLEQCCTGDGSSLKNILGEP